MAIVIPGNAVNFPYPLLAVGLNTSVDVWKTAPTSIGPKCIPVEIDWGTMGGTDKIVGFNIGNAGATQAFTVMAGLHVDNSLCGADIQFVFTDTQETYTVPAYTPNAVFPVFTKSLQFYVISKLNGEDVETADTTRFSMFNFVPPPVVLPTTEEQAHNGIAAIPLNGSTVSQLLTTGTNGTLEGISIQASGPVVGGGTVQIVVADGGGRTLAVASVSSGASTNLNAMVLNLSDLHVRFQNGITMTQTGSNMGGILSVNTYFREP